MQATPHCPDCGTRGSSEPWSQGICPRCLLLLALDDSAAPVAGSGSASPNLHSVATLDLPHGGVDASGTTLAPGLILGSRYRIRSLLGRGGMGEVWRAFDLKLRLDVALKALRTELLKHPSALESLRQEVRAAREVISPNVCRVYDLEEIEGAELVSMEYVDGETLLDLLCRRGPLDLQQAREIAAQFLAGLEAIHGAGLVHRDVKPENVMITRAGRVVMMDFGIAKSLAEGGTATISGTPAYMSPEQARGEAVDARADVFSAGMVLAEMVTPDGIADEEKRRALWRGAHQEPPWVPDSPWAPVLARALAKVAGDRYGSAASLARALEEVRLRVEGAESLCPYPGLASFTERDAEYFFGRELEVEAMWRKLRQPHLLAVIGPSGAGKSSFLRAGLLATAPPGWAWIIATPGREPLAALRAALIPDIAGREEVVEWPARKEETEATLAAVSRWRRRHDHAMVIVDQFEELFTQSSREVQGRFAELLGRLVLEADVHVVLSMRDDFLFHCHRHPALTPILSELTLIGAPSGTALRRAIVQPALKCGYRFEDDSLVDEMLAEVEGERGALPLLAFAAAQLWERREREPGLLTRDAYELIGGVGGALAQHAEETLQRVGEDRTAIVRELFRNLITAEGTRAARERVELLSVFESAERPKAGEVLDILVDARLLTGYELPAAEAGERGRQRIEVVHESLLSAWPRLVRWRTRDIEGAQLREELRQAAHTWDEHERSDDLLWTGTAFREYQLWRERYPGGLTDQEEAFAGAMIALASRRRRRQRLMATVGVSILMVVLAVVTGLWRRSELETRRAEAAKLAALGEVELVRHPTAALAYATASLGVTDTLQARKLAVRALQQSPPLSLLPIDQDANGLVFGLDFSPNGEWLATSQSPIQLRFRDGRAPVPVGGSDEYYAGFAEDDLLITEKDGVHRWWRLPEVDRPLRSEEIHGSNPDVRRNGYFSHEQEGDICHFTWYPLGGGDPRPVGSMKCPQWGGIDPSGSWLAFGHGDGVQVRSLDEWGAEPRRVGEPSEENVWSSFNPEGSAVATITSSGTIGVWPVAADRPEPIWSAQAPSGGRLVLDRSERRLFSFNAVDFDLWDLAAPLGTAPQSLRRTGSCVTNWAVFHPNGRWLVAGDACGPVFWPLTHRYSWLLDEGSRMMDVKFSPDGRWLVSVSAFGLGGSPGQVRAWPLDGQNRGASRVLLEKPSFYFIHAHLDIDSSSQRVAVGTRNGVVHILPLAEGPAQDLRGDNAEARTPLRVDFSPDGTLLAAAMDEPEDSAADTLLRVWDLASGEARDVGRVGTHTFHLEFLDQRSLRWAGASADGQGGMEKIFDLEDDSVEIGGAAGGPGEVDRLVSPDGIWMISKVRTGRTFKEGIRLFRTDRGTGERQEITSHGDSPRSVALDPSGRWLVTGGFSDFVVRVGPVSGEEPHLLYGHESAVRSVAVSPDGNWIASASEGGLRLWPMPDLSKPPLHTLPHDELIAKLKSLTNLRAVRDESDPTGWEIETGPFPGWAEAPEW